MRVNYLGLGRESLFVSYRLLAIMWFLFEEVSSSMDALDGLRYFIVALLEPSIQLVCILFTFII